MKSIINPGNLSEKVGLGLWVVNVQEVGGQFCHIVFADLSAVSIEQVSYYYSSTLALSSSASFSASHVRA